MTRDVVQKDIFQKMLSVCNLTCYILEISHHAVNSIVPFKDGSMLSSSNDVTASASLHAGNKVTAQLSKSRHSCPYWRASSLLDDQEAHVSIKGITHLPTRRANPSCRPIEI